MNPKLTIHIEGGTSGKTLIPWTSVVRRGRLSTEAQFFGLFGFEESDLAAASAETRENAREFLEYALRFATAFEYIPKNLDEAEPFFEKKLAAFQERLKEHGGNIPPFHVGLGIVIGTYVLFANSGDISILSITEQVINSLGELHGGEAFHFGTFRSGTLTPHSYLLFIPKRLGTILKSEELKLLARSRSSEAKLSPIQHLIETRTGQSVTLRAILLEARPNVSRSTVSTESSIAQLLKTEATTEDLLAPPLLRPIIKNLKLTALKAYAAYKHILATYSEKKETRLSPESAPHPRTRQKIRAASVAASEIPNSIPTASQASPKTLSSYFMHALIWSKKGATTRAKTLREKLSTFTTGHSLSANAAQGWFRTPANRMINGFNVLPRKNKLLLLLIALLLFIFAQGVLLAHSRALAQKADSAVASELSEIQGLIDSANASLIYQDETQARTQIEQVKTRIAAFPEFHGHIISEFGLSRFRSANYTAEEAAKKLTLSLAPLQEKLRHVISIETPKAVDPKIVETLALAENTSASHAVTFRKRLYTLHPDLNQILKQEPIKGGFASGTPWITDGTDVRSATMLAIDGSLYVGQSDGRVMRFLKGKKTDFALSPIEPPLTALTDIWTDETSDYLYALDPAQKRLLVFTKKTGALKAQYTSQKFTNLQKFFINEHTKTAYLLNDTNVVSIPLSHFGK